jgi:hypothetical protein
VRDRCRTFIPPGEQLRYLIPGLCGGQVFIAVSDTVITVIWGGLLRRDNPQSVTATHPRTTRIGPVDAGSLDPVVRLGSLTIEIDDEYIPVVAAADAEISAPDFPPPNLLSDG